MDARLAAAGVALFEGTSEACAVLAIAPNGRLRIVAGNPALARVLGTDVDRLTNAPGDVLDAIADTEALGDQVAEAVGDGERRSVDLVTERPDGQLALEMALIPLGDGVLACTRDVSRERATLREVHRIEALGNIGTWTWNAADGHMDLSDQLRRILGLASDDDMTADAVLDLVLPEDRDRLRAAIGEGLQGGGSEEVWFRARRPDGQHREICARGRAVRNGDGHVVRAFGTMQDFTERRELERREQAIERAAVEQFRALELNDDVVQRLARAWLALDLGRLEESRQAIEEGITRVHAIMRELFEATARVTGGLRAGDLARRPAPTGSGAAG